MATIGTFNVDLLAQVAGGEPHNIGTLHIPIATSTASFRPGEGIRVDDRQMMLGFADALEQAARTIRAER